MQALSQLELGNFMNYELYGSAFALALFTIIWFWRRPDWMGFGDKTLWDWVSIAALPVLIGGATYSLKLSQAHIEAIRLQEEGVQNYIERISALALDEHATNHPEMTLAIGRAQTSAVLQMVDHERAGHVLTFLHEMDLLQTFAVDLEDMNFNNADLKELNLDGMDFEESILANADIENSSFRNTDLEDADLRGADLEDADFRGAVFDRTKMRGAELDRTDLRGADLTTALGLSASQIAVACVDETTKLPNDFSPTAAASAGCNAEIDD